MPSLLSVPNELLQNISTFLSCTDVLALFQVNKHLHCVYQDRVVFEQIARRNVYQNQQSIENLESLTCSDDEFNELLKWTEADVLLKGSSLQEAIQVASAVQRCIKASVAEDNLWTFRQAQNSEVYEISTWLPQMLAVNHPAAMCIRPGRLLDVRRKLYSASARAQADRMAAQSVCIDFAFTYTTLMRLRQVHKFQIVVETFVDHFFPDRTRQPLGSPLPARAIDDTIEKLSKHMPDSPSELDYATICAVLVSMIVELVAQLTESTHLIALPVPCKIPFHSIMDLPRLFGNDPSRFPTCHIPKMTTPGFLSGIWQGYYSDPRSFVHRDYDPPMRGINIVARVPNPEDLAEGHRNVTVIDSQSAGVDAHGAFTLAGVVHHDGSVQLEKSYQALVFSWSWVGRVTPFGMVGVWGGDAGQFGGHFWIWKKEWC